MMLATNNNNINNNNYNCNNKKTEKGKKKKTKKQKNKAQKTSTSTHKLKKLHGSLANFNVYFLDIHRNLAIVRKRKTIL